MSPPAAAPQQDSSSSLTGSTSAFLRLRRWRYRVRRRGLGSTTGLVIATLIIGIAIGRWTAPPDETGARRLLEEQVMPLVLDSDGIWTSASDGAIPVSAALVAIQRDEDPTLVQEASAQWLASYDQTITRVAALDLPPEARPVQRQFIAAMTLSRDAVEVLQRAAQVEDASRREGLLTEVGRLRVRGEQLTQAARASIQDLSGGEGEVTPLPDLPAFPALGDDRAS
jgi:hypothetical protein